MGMELQRINLKIALKRWEGSAEDVFKIFNRWISTDTTDVLIDVADYRHVNNGPETLLVGHNANYSFDKSGGDLGLLYSQKRGLEGSLAQRLEKVFLAALAACVRLETEPEIEGEIQFSGGDATLVTNDRLLAPNNGAVRDLIREDLEPFLSRLYSGAGYTIQVNDNAAERPAFHIITDTEVAVAGMLENVS
jgi:hypothetical protein